MIMFPQAPVSQVWAVQVIWVTQIQVGLAQVSSTQALIVPVHVSLLQCKLICNL